MRRSCRPRHRRPTAPRNSRHAKHWGGVMLLTMVEAAKELRASRRWLQEFIKHHPYYRLKGNQKLFTMNDIAKLAEAMPCPSICKPRGARRRRTTRSADNTAASWWTEAQALLASETPRGS